ncbi:MAG TPA: Gfo/Idh/MocA family oxidoreductase [Candidatus Acidoferrales bacterium]|nr:Gfo/Idh/MocA family oxidoreductase [Candidatus Acidoferrales bacterium]
MVTRKNRNGRRKIRYAVVGLGYISQIAVLPAFEHARENSELTALVSSDAEKLKKLGRKYGIENTYTYEQYGDCLKSGEIDAVYIGLPNNMHRAYTESAAEAGIHVLCEKPMAMDEDECETMIAAVKDAGVKLMIAYRLHFERGNLSAMEIVKSGKIGQPRIFTSIFSQQVKAGNSRLDREVAGGAIYDMGVYCINAARYLFRAEPEEVFAWNQSSKDERFAEVPEMTSAMMKFPGNRIAAFTCSFGATDRSEFEIVGTKGSLKMDPGYEMAEDLKLDLTVDGKTKKQVFKKRDQFAPELIYFSDCILSNKQPEPSGEEGLADVRVIQALLQSAETNRPVEIAKTKIERRPQAEQEISKEAVENPPKLVKAAAPGRH